MCFMVVVVGEVLIDYFPDYRRIGGAPFNFAYHLKRLGVPVRLITRIGDDADGKDVQRRLDQGGFSRKDLQVDPHHGTGRVEIRLDDQGVAAFDILTDVAYDYLRLDHLPGGSDWKETDLIYFGSLVQRTPRVADQLAAILARRGPNTRCFCDINLRPPHDTPAAVQACLAQADILKLNDAECRQIARMAGAPAGVVDGVRWLMDRYGIDLAAVTMGAEGSCIVTGQDVVEAPAPAPVRVVDTVGAGDGYGAVLALGLLRGASLKTIAAAAADFAARICTLPGAVPEDDRFYTENPVYSETR